MSLSQRKKNKNITLKKNYYSFYIKSTMPTRYRSAFAKFRWGVAPLKFETGRYENLPADKRFCFNCKNVIEDEKHAILKCQLYANLRVELFKHATVIHVNFNSFNDDEKFVFLFSNDEISILSKSAMIFSELESVLYTPEFYLFHFYAILFCILSFLTFGIVEILYFSKYSFLCILANTIFLFLINHDLILCVL